MKTVISEATRKNWKRLENNASSPRLTRRANKRLSLKKFLPEEYFTDRKNQQAILQILSALETPGVTMTDILCSAAENLFSSRGILERPHVQEVLSAYPYRRLAGIAEGEIPADENDLLGLIYQAAMPEGRKNRKGSYYTPAPVISSMVSHLSFRNGETFLDPCCGSGAFLLTLACENPELLYGIDNDPTAVMIAKFNLLLRYPEKDFIPRIVCGDFLSEDLFPTVSFDYIVTNPPWGAFQGKIKTITEISSGESFSHFFVRAWQRIKSGGVVRFLLPESLLNVKIHQDLRKFILQNGGPESITLCDGSFTGVQTAFIDMQCRKNRKSGAVKICRKGDCFQVPSSLFFQNKDHAFRWLSPADLKIIKQCRYAGKYTLEKSIWALGIVTGDNRGKLKSIQEPDMEAIYTGKEICPYRLKEAVHFIRYDRSTFQQIAREEYYRAPEKLVYKFIADRPIFAYDDRQRLFLNSANILIPAVPGMSIKTVMALLNSELYAFLYRKLSGGVKVLKGNLLVLPFPELSPEEDAQITRMTGKIIDGETEYQEKLQQKIYSLFALSVEDIRYIRDHRFQ